MTVDKLTILHLGEPILYNVNLYKQLTEQFNIIRPSREERSRSEFIKALEERKFGDFHAVLRPFWNSRGEMGRWDSDLIPLLPSTVIVFW